MFQAHTVDFNMLNRDVILKKICSTEDKVLVSKLIDKSNRAEKTRSVIHSDFLDPYQIKLLEKAFHDVNDISYEFFGGYIGAEREVVVFCPKDMSVFEFSDYKYPFSIIQIKTKNKNNLTHRDYLGSLMGLGIKRDKIGDILIEDDSCRVIVITEIAEYIKYNLLKVANCNVQVDIISMDEIETPEQKFTEIKASVASLRLDCIASAGFGISRSKISEYIKAEKLNLNWEKTASVTKQVKEGDTISVRGKGRVVLQTIGNETKKGRIFVTLKKFT